MIAHLGEFGMARFYLGSMLASGEDLGSIDSIGLKGTIGCIAPCTFSCLAITIVSLQTKIIIYLHEFHLLLPF